MPIPNVVQFSNSVPNKSCLRYQNFYTGVQNQDYGPTSSTGFWAGISVPSGGYVLHINKASQGPSIHVFPDDTTAFNFCKNYFTGLPIGNYQSWNNFLTGYWGGNGVNDSIILNKNYENVITDNLVYCVDPSYYLTTTFSAGTPNSVKNIAKDLLSALSSNNQSNSALKSSTNGGILSFDGINNSYIILDLGAAKELSFTGNVTYEFFIRFKELTGTTIPVYFKSPLNEGSLSANTSNKLIYSYGNGTNAQTFQTTTTLSNNTWYHIVLVRDLTTTQKLYWYVNGSEDSNLSATYTSTPTTADNTTFFQNGFGGSVYAEVDLGVLRLYNSALTATQVSQNFNAQKSRFGL